MIAFASPRSCLSQPINGLSVSPSADVRRQVLHLMINSGEEVAARVTESGVILSLGLLICSKIGDDRQWFLESRHESVAGAYVAGRLKRLSSELVRINPEKLRHVPSTRFQIRSVQGGCRSARNDPSGRCGRRYRPAC